MRCLQCGKDVPLLKRLAGSEFCSDAHRREYHQEYSELALGRLLQSKPKPAQGEIKSVFGKHSIEAERAAAGLAPAPAIVGAPTAAKPSPAAKAAETNGAATPPAAKKAEPKTIALPPAQPPPKPVTKVASQPAMAKAAAVQKPAPAVLGMAVVATVELERAFSARTPDRPRSQANLSPAALAPAGCIRWERPVDVADLAVHPREHKLEFREPPLGAPSMELDLSILDAESLGAQDQSWTIPEMSSMAPREAVLWTAPHGDFPGAAISLGDFANCRFSTTGFDERGTSRESESSVFAGAGGAVLVADDTATATVVSRAPEAPIPDPVLEPLPMAVQGIAAGKAKPVQVFGTALFSAGTVRIPQPSGLPLRPVMVLAAAASETDAAPVVTGQSRRAEVRILPATAVKTALPATKTPAPSTAEQPDPGLPELPLLSLHSTGTSRTGKIAAMAAAAAVLAIGSFFFFGNHSHPGFKQAVTASVLTDRWITNFAPDAKRQRTISVLRSSMDLPAYRLEFESSIQIKGLGWVYRAQDPKNFYVSKIELEKAGLNPQYVVAHYAVIGGIDQPRQQTPLSVAVPLGGHYKIRFEAVGDHFTTWLQDQKVDEWTDARLKTGGAGVYSEGIEQSTLHGDFRVMPLPQQN